MKTRKEFKKMQEDFAYVKNNHIGDGKRYEDIEALAFDLYQTTIDQDNKINKHTKFLDLVNQMSSSFHRIDFNEVKLK